MICKVMGRILVDLFRNRFGDGIEMKKNEKRKSRRKSRNKNRRKNRRKSRRKSRKKGRRTSTRLVNRTPAGSNAEWHCDKYSMKPPWKGR